MRSNQNILEIRNLTFGYKKDELLYKDFSLSMKVGEVVSLRGKSGSGKSTLFSLITGVNTPLSGTINSASYSQVFQDPYSSFHNSYTILNQIQDVSTVEHLDSYLEKLNLDYNLLLKKPYELSGGQLQRASILRALLMKPDLLLVDEPTSALDNITGLEVMKLLLTFLDKIAILLITHDTHLALWCSDTVIDIDKGKI